MVGLEKKKDALRKLFFIIKNLWKMREHAILKEMKLYNKIEKAIKITKRNIAGNK